jgi:hypothetical protein
MDRDTGRRAVPLAVAALAPLPFLGALDGGFLAFDDRPNLLATEAWRGLGPEAWRHAFTSLHGGHWQPLAWLSFGVDHARAGLDASAYHATNLVLHAAAALAAYFLLLEILRAAGRSADGTARPTDVATRFGAAAGALLFAVHPLRVESVAWITERRDLVAAVPLLAAVALWLRSFDPSLDAARARTLRRGALVLHGVSLLGKAWGVTLPAVLLALDLFPLRRFGAVPAGALLREKAGFLALALGAAIVAPLAQAEAGALRALDDLGPLDRAALAARGLAYYASATLLPVGLAPLHEIPRPFDVAAPRFLASAVAVAIAAAAAFALRRRRPEIPAALACYAAVLAPVLGLFQSGPQEVADRYAYLA